MDILDSDLDSSQPEPARADVLPDHSLHKRVARGGRVRIFLVSMIVLAVGLGGGYLARGRSLSSNAANEAAASSQPVALIDQVNPPDGYTLPASFGDLGPQLLAAGAIDYARFVQVYEQSGQPLTSEQLAVLTRGSRAPIVINHENAYFLLNFFWALGLTNQNAVLEQGPMWEYNEGEIGSFASTAGWTIGTKPATALYASAAIITLTPEQQARLEEVAAAVYRPCCDNPTAFPDCNHGMAMLGLLELMASQGASVDEMFAAAKYVNAFWFPQQTLELATFFKAARGLEFADMDARELVGAAAFSRSGFQSVHQWLVMNDLLDQVPGGRNSCGV